MTDGPAAEMVFPEPMNNPVPTAPEIAMSWMCLLDRPRSSFVPSESVFSCVGAFATAAPLMSRSLRPFEGDGLLGGRTRPQNEVITDALASYIWSSSATVSELNSCEFGYMPLESGGEQAIGRFASAEGICTRVVIFAPRRSWDHEPSRDESGRNSSSKILRLSRVE